MTMAVVRLSNAAERKKVRTLKIQTSFILLAVLIRSVTSANPSWESINSTMVIAPRRKNKISAISPK